MVNNPFCEYPPGVYEWFLYSSGIYFGELVRHVFFDEHKPDFAEMLIHHLATVFLVFGSAYANQVGIGAIISWLHILTDVPVSVAKITTSLKGQCAEIISAIVAVCILLPTYIYFRVICLPFWIYNIFTNPTVVYPPHLSEFDVFLQLNGFYLLVLQILHIYWTILILKMLIGFLSGGGARDLQEDAETAQDMKDKRE